jgi:hypothetical protein
MNRLERIAATAHLHAGTLLVVFLSSLVALNWGRWSGWGLESFRLYFTQPIMQTTFIHQDAKKHGLRYWYIFLTFPFMPTIGLLIYVLVRARHLSKRGRVPPLGA